MLSRCMYREDKWSDKLANVNSHCKGRVSGKLLHKIGLTSYAYYE